METVELRALPELIRQNREEYYAALRAMDNSFAAGALDIIPMADYLGGLLQQQLESALT